jgi:DNA polymerase (family 10)
MPVHNADIAAMFSQLADLLEIEGANRFRVRAYRNGARTIAGLPRSAAEMVEAGEDLSALAGIGEDLAAKIAEVVETGKLELLEEVKQRTVPELGELLQLPGLGAKRVQTLHQELGITSLADLERAVEDGKVRQLSGFGPRTERNIREALERLQGQEKRTKLAVVEEIAKSLTHYLEHIDGVKEVTVAGSYRRRLETVGDLDILVTCRRGSRVVDRFVDYDEVQRVISHGKTRSSVALRSGLQVDLRVVPQVSYGAALHYFTGSKAHNIAIRRLGQKKHLKINEYGVFRGKKRVAGRTEEEVYARVDLPWIPPELRENEGEIEAARDCKLPTLLTLDDIRGDLHAHTTSTDGRNTLEDMVQAAKKRGYRYLAITDHSTRVAVTQGLDTKRLSKQIEAIDRLNGRLKHFTVLKAIEVDILDDGSLDLPDDILKELDLTVCSIHSKFNLSRRKQTERIIRAMDNPYFTILGHPTGRLLQQRPAYDVDMEQVVEAARQRGCHLELNAQPDRLDPPPMICKMAKEMGVKFAISTDAHTVNDLGFMHWGVEQARRGWLEASDVLNTRNLRDLRNLLRRK